MSSFLALSFWNLIWTYGHIWRLQQDEKPSHVNSYQFLGQFWYVRATYSKLMKGSKIFDFFSKFTYFVIWESCFHCKPAYCSCCSQSESKNCDRDKWLVSTNKSTLRNGCNRAYASSLSIFAVGYADATMPLIKNVATFQSSNHQRKTSFEFFLCTNLDLIFSWSSCEQEAASQRFINRLVQVPHLEHLKNRWHGAWRSTLWIHA